MNDFSTEEKAELRQLVANKPRGHHRMQCPACSKTRRNKYAQCLSVTVHAEHVVYTCHHCEASGATFLKSELHQPFIPPAFEKPKYKAVKSVEKGLSTQAIDYLKTRSISLTTAQTFGLVSSVAWFRELGGDAPAISLPYYVNSKIVGHKVRAVQQKEHVCDTALSSLFGVQNVDLGESADLIICEGEFDALAFYEAGVLNSVSVPNGSSSFNRTNDDGDMRQQLGFLWEARELIEKAKRILIATDNDEPGNKLAEELARRIGKHRCWRVVWPQECKDANDVLMKHGTDELKRCASEAEPWPVVGVYEVAHYLDDVYEMFENGLGERISTGMAAVDEIFSVAPGMLTVLTGIPGHGKSTFVDQIIVNLARTKGYVAAICSFENPPKIHIGKLAAMLTQRHFFQTDEPGEKMTKKQLDAVLPFVHRHFKFVFSDDGNKSTIESVIERIKTAVFRWGAQIAVIDPVNYLARTNAQDSETQWADSMLTDLRLAAQSLGIHIFLIGHPTKMPMNGDGTYAIPKGYSISGSSAYFSKPDFGISVYRESNGDVTICNWKSRYDWLGKVGNVTILYDSMRHMFVSSNWSDFLPYEGDKE